MLPVLSAPHTAAALGSAASTRGRSPAAGVPVPRRRPHATRTRAGSQPDGPREPRRGGGGFFTGMLLGGAVFGALGLLFAPQVSSALLKGRDALRMPRSSDGESREEDDDAAESASSSADALNEKIRALNLAIDEFTAEADDAAHTATTTHVNGMETPRLQLQLEVEGADVRTG